MFTGQGENNKPNLTFPPSHVTKLLSSHLCALMVRLFWDLQGIYTNFMDSAGIKTLPLNIIPMKTFHLDHELFWLNKTHL
jgi:hypothetical protein